MYRCDVQGCNDPVSSQVKLGKDVVTLCKKCNIASLEWRDTHDLEVIKMRTVLRNRILNMSIEIKTER